MLQDISTDKQASLSDGMKNQIMKTEASSVWRPLLYVQKDLVAINTYMQVFFIQIESVQPAIFTISIPKSSQLKCEMSYFQY